MAHDDDDTPPRNPLLDPRLAGAGGMLIAAAAIAFLFAHGTQEAPTPSHGPTTTVTASR